MQAARELMAEGGVGAVTMDGVAARASVGKPTVYRWWPDRHAVAMAALMHDDKRATSQSRTTKSSLLDLRKQLRAIAQRFSDPSGRHAASLIASADSDSELSKAFRNHFVLARRSEGRALLEQAVANGEIKRSIEIEVVLDLLYGALFFRLLLGHAPLDQKFVDQVLDHALQ